MEQELPCASCGAAGVKAHWHTGELQECTACRGAGHFERPLFSELLDRITRQERGKTILRASAPSHWCPKDTPKDEVLKRHRAYFLWRLARFHGGLDVRFPDVAYMLNERDPYLDLLEQWADEVAKSLLGTNMAAAARWGMALGYTNRVPAGLPPTAYPGGPEHDRAAHETPTIDPPRGLAPVGLEELPLDMLETGDDDPTETCAAVRGEEVRDE